MACNKIADTSTVYLAYGLQSDCGVMQTELTNLRITGHSLGVSAEATQSGEITGNRRVTDLIRTSQSVSGDINFQFSYKEFDPFIEAVLGSTASLDGAGTFIYDGGANTVRKYFTFETKFEGSDGAGGTQDYFFQFMDCEIDTMTLNIATGDIISGTMSVIGTQASTSTTSIDPNTIDASQQNVIYDASTKVSAIEVDLNDGNGYVGELATTLTLNLQNNKREQRAIGSVFAAGVGNGDFTSPNAIEIYFTDNSTYQQFLDDKEFKWRVILDDNSDTLNGNQYTFKSDRSKFGNVPLEIAGPNTDIVLSSDFEALDDFTNGVIGVASLDAAPTP